METTPKEKQSNRVNLTAGRVDAFTCPAGKAQSFLWDTDTPTLALRATPKGRKTYVFEARLNGATIRINIGTVADWPIGKARTKAQGYKMLVDAGTDPREVERDRQAAIVEKKVAAVAKVSADKLLTAPASDAWDVYLEARRDHWSERHYQDHIDISSGGGVPRKRGAGKTIAGPLHTLLALSLRDMTPAQEIGRAHV